jgi:hypothetical protein
MYHAEMCSLGDVINRFRTHTLKLDPVSWSMSCLTFSPAMLTAPDQSTLGPPADLKTQSTTLISVVTSTDPQAS